MCLGGDVARNVCTESGGFCGDAMNRVCTESGGFIETLHATSVRRVGDLRRRDESRLYNVRVRRS